MGKAEFRSLVWGSGTSRYWMYSNPFLRGQSLAIQSEFSRCSWYPADRHLPSISSGTDEPRYCGDGMLPKSRFLNPNIGESIGE